MPSTCSFTMCVHTPGHFDTVKFKLTGIDNLQLNITVAWYNCAAFIKFQSSVIHVFKENAEIR